MKKFTNVSNYGKFIYFGMGCSKNRGIRVNIQFNDWISRDGPIKNFFYIRAGRKLVGGKILPSIKQLYTKIFIFFVFISLCLVDLRICVFLNRAKPWLELNIKFSWYSRRSFQRALVGFNNLWIHLISNKFNWVSMSKIYLTEFSKWGAYLTKILYSLFYFFSDIFWNSVYLTYVP